jgi:hypothetical protein
MTKPDDVNPVKRDDSAADSEGTIRFAYGLQPPDGPVTDSLTLQTLRGWRTVLRRLELVGQDPQRYDGLGFGNLSHRDAERPEQFVITASQTAGLPELEDGNLVRITHSNTSRFWVDAVGHQPPSSETLSHAIIYQADASVSCVLHVHSPDIWLRADELDLAATDAAVSYGSPAMAEAVAALLAAHRAPLTFVTRGHRDGVFACARSAEDAGAALIHLLARAMA